MGFWTRLVLGKEADGPTPDEELAQEVERQNEEKKRKEGK